MFLADAIWMLFVATCSMPEFVDRQPALFLLLALAAPPVLTAYISAAAITAENRRTLSTGVCSFSKVQLV